MKYKIKKKRKPIKVIYIVFILVLVLILASTSYSLWSTRLTINGTIHAGTTILPVTVVRPTDNPDRLTTNTSLRAGILSLREVFIFDSDKYEGQNTVVTSIRNGDKVWIVQETLDVTFTLEIQNNSNTIFTDPQLEIEEYDPSNRMEPQSQNVNDVLSVQNVPSGDSVTITAEISFNAQNDITVGSYVNYKISFMCDGVRCYYNYKILISE